MKTLKHMLLTGSLICAVTISYGQAFKATDRILSIGIGPGGERPADHPGTSTRYSLRVPPLAIGVNYQHGIHEWVSVGGYFSHAFSSALVEGYETSYQNLDGLGGNNDFVRSETSSIRRRHVSYFGIRGEFHASELIGLMKEIDLYGAISLGGAIRVELLRNGTTSETITYNNNGFSNTEVRTSEWTSSYAPGNDFGTVGVAVGARYYFEKYKAVYAEAGISPSYRPDFFGLTYVQVGVSLKL